MAIHYDLELFLPINILYGPKLNPPNKSRVGQAMHRTMVFWVKGGRADGYCYYYYDDDGYNDAGYENKDKEDKYTYSVNPRLLCDSNEILACSKRLDCWESYK